MSHVHFVANAIYKKRVVQLGENPKNVYVVGGLGIDSISKANLLSSHQLEKKFDLKVNLDGSGLSAQADAVALGISRALIKYDPELREKLKKAGLLTRDARKVERKKYGLKKARRAEQFTKR